MNVQRYARIAGVLFLISLVAGGFGEAYVPSKLIVSADAAATAANIRNFDFLYRLGFAAFLIESLSDITLVLILYALLKPVSKELSLLAAFFGLVGTALFAFAELFYFAPPLIMGSAGYLKTFSPDQLNALVLLSLDCEGLLDLSFRLSSQVPRGAYGDRRNWICRKELPADPRARLRLRRAADLDVSGWTDTNSLVAGERSRRYEVERESKRRARVVNTAHGIK